MCTIEECDGKVVAKGLCAKHYMRARRHGSPDAKLTPGPKPNEYRQLLRTMFSSEMSPRTFARYVAAQKLVDTEEFLALIKRATRPNGSLNVQRLYDMAVMSFLSKFAR